LGGVAQPSRVVGQITVAVVVIELPIGIYPGQEKKAQPTQEPSDAHRKRAWHPSIKGLQITGKYILSHQHSDSKKDKRNRRYFVVF
jgi:hypothetical protein